MQTEIIVAVIALIGTLAGSFAGGAASASLTRYRLKQLEQKVDEHNHYAQRLPLVEEKLAVANHRIADLEKKSEWAQMGRGEQRS